MKIKICGMTDERAVEAAVNAGVDALGFVFANSPRELTPERAQQLAAAVPAGIARVAVTHHPSIDRLREILEVFDPDCLQSDAEDFKDLEVRRGPRLLPVYRQGRSQPGLFMTGEQSDTPGFVPDFVYEGPRSGQGETVDWQRAADFACRGRMLLAGGLDAANVGEAIVTVRPWGVDVSSGVEDSPGHKDPRLIAAFVDAVRRAQEKLEEESVT